MNLYAAALSASRATSVIVEVGGRVVVFLATTDDEATGRAHREANREFPVHEGWGNHSVSTLAVPEHLLRAALASDTRAADVGEGRAA